MLDEEEIEMQEGYKELKVYQRSYKAAIAIYKMTSKFPKEERHGITDQIRRAAVSISLNIAEGYAKKESQAEFKRFLMIAQGSTNEVSVLLDFAKDLEMLEGLTYEKARAEYEEIGKMLTGLIKTLTKTSI